MTTRVLTGSKNEIAESVARIDGVIREVIVFLEEPSETILEPCEDDIFAEMEPFTVREGVRIARASRSTAAWRVNDPLGHQSACA